MGFGVCPGERGRRERRWEQPATDHPFTERKVTGSTPVPITSDGQACRLVIGGFGDQGEAAD
jgi:hypothetical protein